MSCEGGISRNPVNGPDLDTASDYGSDFTPEEQELLNRLLNNLDSNASAVANNPAVPDADVTSADPTASQEVALSDLLDTLPAPGVGDSKDIEVTDIEDYEEPKGIRFPMGLGKEQWIPLWKKKSRAQLPRTAASGNNSSDTDGTALAYFR
jgi:exonuclease V